MNTSISKYFRTFSHPIDHIQKPHIFNYPFVVDTHPLCEIAIAELQDYLTHTRDFIHDFGIDQVTSQSIGKMFGVLVVENIYGEMGYLCAYSGKLANSNHVSFFVPPVFDMLTSDGFFIREELILNEINAQIVAIEEETTYKNLLKQWQDISEEKEIRIRDKKQQNKELKNKRKQLREEQKNLLDEKEYQLFEADLITQSLRDKHELNSLIAEYSQKLNFLKQQIEKFELQIRELKEKRKVKSNILQKRLFQSYSFLNAKGETKNLLDIFESHLYLQPPAGAGECCAPKLLQFAYLHQLKPLAIAEFWWGSSPKSEIKQHKNIYPACWGKCQPILQHMLEGIEVKENPFLQNPAEGKEIEIIYDDTYLVVVNKPAEFLSVPGIHVHDSVYERIRWRYPNATGPLIVHRLDMSTSGLMVLAKSKEIHKHLQHQFIKHLVTKRYVALLEGEVKDLQGTICLPLRVNLDDRPKQVVCYQYGKEAITRYEVIEKTTQYTRVNFYPITGRTHQLRMHAAHHLGLNAPIKGDDLYGKISDRLYLHAEELNFIHPITKEKLTFVAKAPF